MASFAKEFTQPSTAHVAYSDLRCKIVAASIRIRATTLLGREWIRQWRDFGVADGESLVVASCYWEDIYDAASADGVRIAVEPGS